MLEPMIVSLPIADRQASFDFFVGALGFEAVGAEGDDGLPEPMQLRLNAGVHVMLVPTGGFEWVVGNHEVATAGTSECVLGISVVQRSEVDEVVDRARTAGAQVVTEPGLQPWGYAGTFADLDGHLWEVFADSP